MFSAAWELPELAGAYIAIGLLALLAFLLAKLISAFHYSIDLGIVSFEPLGWLAGLLQNYLLDGVQVALHALEGAAASLQNGLIQTWNDEIRGATIFAGYIRSAFLYLWGHALKPFVTTIVRPFEALAQKAEAEVASLTKTVAVNLVKAETFAKAEATTAFNDARAFTRTEITTVRQDFTRADGLIDARLHGIGTQAQAIAGDIAASPGLVWDDLKKYLSPTDLAQATILGVLGALGIHSLTTATGLDSSDCQNNQKALCGTDHGQWLKLLEGLALLGFTLDFQAMADFAGEIVTEAGAAVSALADDYWKSHPDQWVL